MAGRFQTGWVIVTVLLTVGCTGCAEEPTGVVGTGPPVIVPGAPGSPGRTATPGERLASSREPVAADVRFAEGMIPHHRQALDMAGLAAGRTGSKPVRALAERIALTQEPEIRLLTEWLAALGRAPGAHGHTSGQAYGMASEEQLAALRAARGREFDRLFVELMIKHHEGAMKMAEEELAAGNDHRMLMIARDVYTDQGIEVARMRALT
ncbi:DUF305 domain-containing protein [Nonomuraea sp. NPDC050328]|uniref:DUF305 domain-containing protein n=1 Tax=Nonomuraea sp. NPDC050328 TaxID=3364361 RepID=UPI00379D3CED